MKTEKLKILTQHDGEAPELFDARINQFVSKCSKYSLVFTADCNGKQTANILYTDYLLLKDQNQIDLNLTRSLIECLAQSENPVVEASAMIKSHREVYAEKKFNEGIAEFEATMIANMEAYQKKIADDPKKELYSQFLKMTVEYWKANPFPKPVISHPIN